MKKIHFLFLAMTIMFLFVNVSTAEEFSVRGMKFGMTIDEIKSTETLELEKYVEGTGYWFDGTLSGYANSRLLYRFDTDGGMNCIGINYGDPQTLEEIESAYTIIDTGLRTKYGEPLGNKNGEVFTCLSPSMESLMNNFYPAAEQLGATVGYDEWWLEHPEGHIKIDHYYVFWNQNGSITAVHSLEYTLFPDTDMNTVINDL